MIQRSLFRTLQKSLHKGKAIVVIGPRQVGKTTLLREVAENDPGYLFLDGDDPSVRQLLDQPNTEELRRILGLHTLVFIDEAQLIPGIGRTLKIITDQFKKVQLLVSGSSAFDLGSKTNEPLTGRKREYTLYPISWEEWENHSGYIKTQQQLEQCLIYGMYPEVLNHPGEEREVLRELVNSYLYKDILSFSGIRKPEIIQRLLQALALQVGHEVSYNELSQLLQISKDTVSNYIDVLEKAFVVFRLNSFGRSLRDEIKTNRKIYFYDNGIRNMLIGNFNQPELREDMGALWENFLVCERKKRMEYLRVFPNTYFWRTKHQQEIDYVEEGDGKITGFEFKWNPAKKVKLSRLFMETYDAEIVLVNRENFRSFVIPDEVK